MPERTTRARALAALDRLATFPEQNPNLVIETDMQGIVTYLNPVAAAAFPCLRDPRAACDAKHPLLADVTGFVAAFRLRGVSFSSREVEVGDEVYEQKVCYTPMSGDPAIRIYAHDITALKRAEMQVTELARAVLKAQESERHRIARELHDESGQALAALKISLQLLAAESPPDIADQLGDAVALVESTRERIRRLAYGLRPAALDTLGLSRSLELLCLETSELTHLAVTYRGRDTVELTDEAAVCLYRFVQEALTNVVVHAGATRAYVRLNANHGTVRLRVADNGSGMDTALLDDPMRTGLGIVGMRERLELLSGRLEATSVPGMGTEMIAVLPQENITGHVAAGSGASLRTTPGQVLL